ncbi:hypothetical protein RBE51_21815 [Pseudomonas taiwanensis]|uniref:hypothetical protein n=1 Tax=Pseudomonas taiwanensis TaxID=470150 RepID=UPI0028DFA3A3|nr:hypothetical protein [Pseudomonas taiwanensis]MDT8925437.1 hypothetical protein [Pseudomonas taiwanensis]
MPAMIEKLDPYHYRFYSEKLEQYRSILRYDREGVDAPLLSLSSADQVKLFSVLGLDFKSFRIRDLDDLRHIQSRHDDDLFKPAVLPTLDAEQSQPDEAPQAPIAPAQNPTAAADEPLASKPGFLKALQGLFTSSQNKLVSVAAQTLQKTGGQSAHPRTAAAPEFRPQEMDSMLARKSLTGILAYALERREPTIDWQSLLDVYNQASPTAQASLDGLFKLLTDSSIPELLTPPGLEWGRPSQISEGASRKVIMGRTYIENESKHWLREDRYIQRYFIYATLREHPNNQPTDRILTGGGMLNLPRYRLVDRIQLVGTTGSLEGAIEVALLVSRQLPNQQQEGAQWGAVMNIYEGPLITRNNPALLSAEIQHKQVEVAGSPAIESRLSWQRSDDPTMEKVLMDTLAMLGNEESLAGFLEDDLNL